MYKDGGSKPPPYGISGEIFVGRGLAPAGNFVCLYELFYSPHFMECYRIVLSNAYIIGKVRMHRALEISAILAPTEVSAP